MGSLLSSFYFAQPLALLLAPLAALLVLAYLRKQSGSRKVVASVLILKALAKHQTIKRRFKPPLRFFLELLALLLLAAAAAAPVWQSPGDKVAILLDSSMSMRALAGPESRLSVARRALVDWLDEQPSENHYSLFTSAPALRRKGDSLISAADLRSELREVEAELSADNIPLALEQLATEERFDRVIVVTDRPVETVRTGTPGADSLRVEALPLTFAGHNLYLSDVAIEGVNRGERGYSVKVTAHSASLAPAEASIRLFTVERDGSKGRPLGDARQVTLRPGQESLVSFVLTGEPDAIVAEISGEPASDVLLEDDRAWAAPGASQGIRLLLVSDELPAAESGIPSLTGFEVDRVTARDFAALSPAEVARASFIVFHKSAPTVPPPVSSLLILPPEGNTLFPVRSVVESPRLTSWQSSHPLTSYLRVPLLKSAAAVVFDTPEWAQAVVNVEQGAILVAGESRGYRFAAAGIELLPFEGQKTPTLSVLTLNLFRWLSGAAELQSGLTPGSSLALEGEKSWVISGPDNNIVTLESSEDTPTSFTFAAPGIYRITSVSGSHADAMRQESETIVVNTFSPQESALYPPPTLTLPDTLPTPALATPGASVLWPILLRVALFILLLDILLQCFPVRRRADSAGGALSTT